MPNHVHLLISINGISQASLSNIIRMLKAEMTLTLHANGIVGKIWQPSFHDHIVRNQADFDRLYKYIQNNPLRWELDCMYDHRLSQAEACATEGVR